MKDRKTDNCPSCGYPRSSSDYWQHSCIRVLQKDRAGLQEQYHDLLLEVTNVAPSPSTDKLIEALKKFENFRIQENMDELFAELAEYQKGR